MNKIDLEEGRYRILLIGIGGNSKEEKDSFCHRLSKKYKIFISAQIFWGGRLV